MLKLRDELAREVDRLSGVAITASLAPDAVEIGSCATAIGRSRTIRFRGEGKTMSLDRKLRETFAAMAPAGDGFASGRNTWRW